MFPILKLARNRLRSDDDYRAMQAYIATMSVNELEQRSVCMEDCDVLELAAGRGGYSTVLNSRAKSLLANEIDGDTYFQEQGIPFLAFDVMAPFPLPAKRRACFLVRNQEVGRS